MSPAAGHKSASSKTFNGFKTCRNRVEGGECQGEMREEETSPLPPSLVRRGDFRNRIGFELRVDSRVRGNDK